MITRWRFRCYPTEEQARHLSRMFGCCRFVYNRFLHFRTDAYRSGGKSVSYAETSRLLTALKQQPETDWLNDVSSVALQQSLRHLQTAFVNFFDKRSAYPNFKKKDRKQSATYSRTGFRWDAANSRLIVAKIGRLKVRWSRDILVEPSSVTITRMPSGRHFVTLTLDVPARVPMPKNNSIIGVDLGISRLATLSTGETVPNPKHLQKRAKRLARQQRKLARKVKGSNRYRKQKQRVARIHERIADARKDSLDKLTTRLAKEHGTIGIEDLNIRGMVKNHNLARSISDAGFGMFRTMLTYKAARAGRTLVVVDRFFPSSKLCNVCGRQMDFLPLRQRAWVCLECHTHHDRDVNAAVNLAKIAGGQSVTVRGGDVRPSKA